MYDEELRRVGKVVDNLIKENFFSKKQVYMFGSSNDTKQVIQLLNERKMEVVCVLDNDVEQQKGLCAGVPVIAVPEILKMEKERICVLIYSVHWFEMKKQLLQLGIQEGQIIVLCQTEMDFNDYLEEAQRGQEIYEQLVKEYNCKQIFLCPYTGTGDIYLIGTFWGKYLRKKEIKDYIFIVISGACEKVTRLFEIKNVVVFKRKEDAGCLIRYYMMHRDSVNLKLLNDSWRQNHVNPIEWLRGYKGLDFRTMFCRYVFDFPANMFGSHPDISRFQGEVGIIFEQNKLERGNTVVIAPYSNTLMELPDAFWLDIVDELKKIGYVVCTNCAGEKEKEIEGTIRLSLPLQYVPQLVQQAGFFIGVRSGLCDIISGTHARKVVLYDKHERCNNCSSYEYFSLKKTYLCSELNEIEIDLNELELVKRRVMDLICMSKNNECLLSEYIDEE